MDMLRLIGRERELFEEDIRANEKEMCKLINGATFLVLGGAGSIGQAVVREIFQRNPKALHVVDINENNLVELVRDIRSSLGYIEGEFKTFAIDCGSYIFEAFFEAENGYDYVLNLSALKHVRSERDPFTLMRMIDVNILNVEKTLRYAINRHSKKYFCVSTDKAANPVNMMGASKRIMEMFLSRASYKINTSTARFANVLFSDGSLLCGFKKRIEKRQPLSAPYDVKRYFILPKESGELCLMSCLLAENRDIFFPKLNEELHLIKFSDIAITYLEEMGYTPYLCDSEDEARGKVYELISKKRWPCYFFETDTTGEKSIEEFYRENEVIDWDRFLKIGVIRSEAHFDEYKLKAFKSEIDKLKKAKKWRKKDLVNLFLYMAPEFEHEEKNRYLDEKM